MASITQYTGSRYVPVFADPAEWNSTRTYEPLTIVLNEGNSYTSRQYVPVGVELTNTDYWLETGNYNAQVEQYYQQVVSLSNKYNNTVQAFATVAAMKQANYLQSGMLAITQGYHTIGKGAGLYYIVSSATANEMDVIALDNGTYAVLIVTNAITPEMIGAYGDGMQDDTEYLSQALSYANVELIGTYLYTSNIELTNQADKVITGKNGTIIAANDTHIIIYGVLPASNTINNHAGIPQYNCTVKNVIFDSNANTTNLTAQVDSVHTLLRIGSFFNAIIDGCTFKNAPCNGANIMASPNPYLINCTFDNIGYGYPLIHRLARNAFDFQGEYLPNVSFYTQMQGVVNNCNFYKIANECIAASTCEKITITNCNASYIEDYFFEITTWRDSVTTNKKQTEIVCSNCNIDNITACIFTNSDTSVYAKLLADNINVTEFGSVIPWYYYRANTIASFMNDINFNNSNFIATDTYATYTPTANLYGYFRADTIKVSNCVLDYKSLPTAYNQPFFNFTDSCIIDNCKFNVEFTSNASPQFASCSSGANTYICKNSTINLVNPTSSYLVNMMPILANTTIYDNCIFSGTMRVIAGAASSNYTNGIIKFINTISTSNNVSLIPATLTKLDNMIGVIAIGNIYKSFNLSGFTSTNSIVANNLLIENVYSN